MLTYADAMHLADEGSACGYDSQGEFRCKLTSARVGGGGHALAALKQTEPKKANPPPRKHYTYVPPPPPTSTFRHTGNATRDEKFKKAHPPPAKKAGAPPPPPDDVAKLLAPAPPADVAKAIAEARAKRLAANEAVVTVTLSCFSIYLYCCTSKSKQTEHQMSRRRRSCFAARAVTLALTPTSSTALLSPNLVLALVVQKYTY